MTIARSQNSFGGQDASFIDDVVTPSRVAIARGPSEYGGVPPYSPSAAYPEYPFANEPSDGRYSSPTTIEDPYAAVRESLRLLGLDPDHYGTSQWNPLGCVVEPGDTVVLKPNLVREYRESAPGDGQCTITHGSVIRAVADYVYLALHGSGRIIIADAPISDANFAAICRITGLNELQLFYKRAAGFNIEIQDLRPEVAEKIDGVIVGHRPIPGDPEGYAIVDLGGSSAFVSVQQLCGLLYGSEYDTREIRRHHVDGRHAYSISRTVLLADCVISIPKLKTHKKVGLTVNLKNLVGINGNKNLLPHHREGTPAQGGDQFADDAVKNRVELRTLATFKRVFPYLGPLRSIVAWPIKAAGKRMFGDTSVDRIRSGNWYGNDTTWRMVHDLNRILLYADAEGRLHDRLQRRFFSVVDGIVAGQGNGPLDATAKPCGVVLAGTNSVAIDFTCARLMNFDWQRLPVLRYAFDAHPLAMTTFGSYDVVSRSNDDSWTGRVMDFEGDLFAFKPHFGWTGHVERGRDEVAAAVAETRRAVAAQR
jgi:uncharacterized protein (DUF362 family)